MHDVDGLTLPEIRADIAPKNMIVPGNNLM